MNRKFVLLSLLFYDRYYTMFKKSQHWDYSKYYASDKQLVLSERAIEYFRTLDSFVQDPQRLIPQTAIVPKKVLESFKKFTNNQKVRYMSENIRYLSSLSSSKNLKGSYILTKKSKIIEAQCMKKTMLCFYRQISSIKLDTESRILILKQQENLKMLELQNYLVRSKKQMFKYKIYLDSIVGSSKSWASVKNYQFTLDEEEFHRIYDDLYNCVIDIRNQELISLFSWQNTQKTGTFRADDMHQKIINKKQYQQFINHKKRALEQIGISHIPFQTKIHEQKLQNSKLTISQRSKQKNLFKAQILSNEKIYNIKQKVLDIIEENRNQLLIESIFLENYQESVSSCVALLEKYYLENKAHTSIYMREIMSVTGLLLANSLKSLVSIQEKKRYDDFIFMKAIDSPLVKSFFNYMCFFADERLGDDKYISEITIVGQFNMNQNLTIQSIKQYFTQFYEAIFDIPRTNALDLVQKQSFKNSRMVLPKQPPEAINIDQQTLSKILIHPPKPQQNQQIMVEFAEPETGNALMRNKFISEQKQETQSTTVSFTKHRFQVKPLSNYSLEQNTVKDNFMKGDWVKSPDGGVICTNEKLLTEHKKIFKHILASIGSNILKGGNILNVSLPVTIFKKQNHLQMVADSFSLSPKMLQNISDPLQRMKRAIVVSVSVGTLGISVQKPFFPTLGQTLQVWIGGCPMYMQQILRYPPTSAYLFYGRGYRIHGQIEPKISFGLNGGKGYNQRPSYIEFDDGQKIELSYGKLVISGIFFGQREFNFYDKVFAYDKKNNYYAELIFGARDTQLFGKNKQTSDFLYGKIYELTEQFVKKFEQSQPPKPYPSKKYIVKVLSQFEGYWNGQIKFDDKTYVNFLEDLPNKVQPEQFALPSDSRFRKDLVNLLNGNVQEAQKQKQILEETQRRDRKLRAQMAKKKK